MIGHKSPIECEKQAMPSMWEQRPDEVLLAESQRDPEAFAEFYRRHERAVLSYFLRRTGHAEITADLTAEVFAAAFQAAKRFRPGGPPALAWLYGIARHKLAASARRGRIEDRARRRLGVGSIDVSAASIERIEALAGEDTTWAGSLIDELPADQREALLARVVEERDYADVARVLNCSEAAARKRVSRGLQSLRARVQGEDV